MMKDSDINPISRRKSLLRSAACAAVLASASLLTAQTVEAPAGGNYTKGSAFLDAYFDPGQEIRDAVRLRYRCRVEANECQAPGTWKIVFMFIKFYKPGSNKTYSIQSQFNTGRKVYPHLSRNKSRVIPGDTGFSIGVTDNKRDRRVGAHSLSPDFFPTLDAEVDYIQDLWRRTHFAQVSMLGENITVEISRGDVRHNLKNWCVHGHLPEGDYRIWRASLATQTRKDMIDFALPEDCATHLYPKRIMQIATEAFVVHPGLLKVFVWDIEIQREGKSTWEPIQRWKVVRRHAPPDQDTWGMKLVTYEGQPAIELSNDGTHTYAREGDIIDMAEPAVARDGL